MNLYQDKINGDIYERNYMEYSYSVNIRVGENK